MTSVDPTLAPADLESVPGADRGSDPPASDLAAGTLSGTVAEHYCTLILMPASTAATVALTACAVADMVSLTLVLACSSGFYAIWAVRNYYVEKQTTTKPKEKGHITMGVVCIGSFIGEYVHAVAGQVVAVVGCCLVVLSFVVATKIVGKMTVEELARRPRFATVLKARVVKAYFVAGFFTWLFALVALIRSLALGKR